MRNLLCPPHGGCVHACNYDAQCISLDSLPDGIVARLWIRIEAHPERRFLAPCRLLAHEEMINLGPIGKILWLIVLIDC